MIRNDFFAFEYRPADVLPMFNSCTLKSFNIVNGRSVHNGFQITPQVKKNRLDLIVSPVSEQAKATGPIHDLSICLEIDCLEII